ncbi:MAG: FG-GAP repeat protein [Candidatus Heimdallarchaeota archaeon]|nr:FG-GAP repeat protein [Candidatus Heimdallarchaeota archaeon]
MIRMQFVFITALIIFVTCVGFLFSCNGGINPYPKIDIQDSSGNLIANGTGSFDFGDLRENGSLSKTFTIKNLGSEDLKLTGSPMVSISGSYAFGVSVKPSSPISPSNSTNFVIRFHPRSAGIKTATVTILNNDPHDYSYTFEITGNSYKPNFDFNGDGFDDVVVGAEFDDDGGNNSGCAFIFFGSSNSSSSIDASNADVKLIGEDAYDQFGHSVSSAGDVNNDGYVDVIVGAVLDDDGGRSSGCAFIFFGSSNPPSTIDASNADVKLIGRFSQDCFGLSVGSAGDVNNDGFIDVIVGAPYVSSLKVGDYFGAAYIFYGSSNMASTINASNANVKLFGKNAGDQFGKSVSSAGDTRNSGFDDVIVGALYDDDGGKSSGCAFIFFGRANMPTSINASNANTKLIGEDAFDFFGASVSTAGDLNKDGLDDVIVGAYGADGTGCAYIFYGIAIPPSPIIYASNADVKLIGSGKGGGFGKSVSTAGDVDNDGYDDVIVGAQYDNLGGDQSGCAYIFLGSTNMASTIEDYKANIKLVGGDSEDFFGCSVSNAGDVNNDGFDDVIVGAYGDDGGYNCYNSGCAFIFYGEYSHGGSATIDASNADVKLTGEDAGVQFGCSVSGGR